jgi:pilus assembly protein CpaB
MNRRLLTIFSVAFVIALACTWWVVRKLNAHDSAPKQGPTSQVVAAARDIPLGAVIAQADLATVAIAGDLPKGAVLKQNENEILGRGVVSEIYQGDLVTENRLSGSGVGGGLAPTIPKGMRACAVKVDDVVGVAGFVIPGTRVDVLGSGLPPNAPPSMGQETYTILQNLQVLSAGTDIQRDAQGKPQQVQVVTLLVTPDQAETLSLASTSLKIQLALRNPLDTEVAKLQPTEMQALFGTPVAAPKGPRRAATVAQAPKPQTYSIIVSNGSKTMQQTYPISGGQH